MEFPDTITFELINQMNVEYDAEKIRTLSDFYEGGDDFEENKDEYLYGLTIEKQKGGAVLRASRLERSAYINHPKSIVDEQVSAVWQEEPTFRIPEDADKENRKYWDGLLTNVDTKGQDWSAFWRDRFLQCLIQRRAYVVINFPTVATQSTDLGEQKKAGALSPFLTALDAKDITDWEKDDSGTTLWVKSFRKDLVRASPLDEGKYVYCWTYFTKDAICEYTLERSVKDEKAKKTIPPKTPVSRSALNPKMHDFGALTVIEIPFKKYMHAMRQLLGPAKAHFNADSSRTWAIHRSALNVPVWSTEPGATGITLSESMVLRINKGDTYEFVGPDSAVFATLTTECEYLLSRMRDVPHSMATYAAGQKDNARQSGTAKTKDKSSRKNLLLNFAACILDAMRLVINPILGYREDGFTVEPKGLSKIDEDDSDIDVVADTTAFVAIPGIYPHAQRMAMDMLCDEYFDEISEDDKNKLKAEGDKFEANPPLLMPPPAVAAPPGNSPAITEKPKAPAKA